MFQRHHNFFYSQRNFCPKNKKIKQFCMVQIYFLNYTQNFLFVLQLLQTIFYSFQLKM